MKKLLIALALIATISFGIIDVFATNDLMRDTNNMMNDTKNTIDIYGEKVQDAIDDAVDTVTGRTMDGLSVGITVASVITLAGVVFFYLVPKH